MKWRKVSLLVRGAVHHSVIDRKRSPTSTKNGTGGIRTAAIFIQGGAPQAHLVCYENNSVRLD